jgi:uncharacterized protein YccT (UPF0319 family)
MSRLKAAAYQADPLLRLFVESNDRQALEIPSLRAQDHARATAEFPECRVEIKSGGDVGIRPNPTYCAL